MASIPERPMALQREGPPRSPASPHSRWLRTRLLRAVSSVNVVHGAALELTDEDDGYPGEDDPSDWMPLHLLPHPNERDDPSDEDWRDAESAKPAAPALHEHHSCAALLGTHDAAREEHARNASPERLLRFCTELTSLGAPPELLQAARAAVEGQRTDTPQAATFPMVVPSLAELAATTLRDGAVSHTLAAARLAEDLQGLSDGPARDALSHELNATLERCELAWASLCWMLCIGDRDVRTTLQAVWNTLGPIHDSPGPEQQCVREVLQPVFVSLLALDLAA